MFIFSLLRKSRTGIWSVLLKSQRIMDFSLFISFSDKKSLSSSLEVKSIQLYEKLRLPGMCPEIFELCKSHPIYSSFNLVSKIIPPIEIK